MTEPKYAIEKSRDAAGRFVSAAALLTDELAVEVLRQALKANPYGPLGPYPPLTRRQRFRIWRSDLRWRLHDFLFPDCHRDDDW